MKNNEVRSVIDDDISSLEISDVFTDGTLSLAFRILQCIPDHLLKLSNSVKSIDLTETLIW